MGTRIVIVGLIVVLAAILLLGRSQQRQVEEDVPEDAGAPPSLAADVESLRSEALGTAEPGPEVEAVEAAFQRYMGLENRAQQGELYADDASIYYWREQTDDQRTGNTQFSGARWKAFLNGTGPSPIVEEEPEYSDWSDISYRRRDDGSVSVSATRHAAGYATPHELLFRSVEGRWLIASEQRTRLGPWRRVEREPDPPVEPTPD